MKEKSFVQLILMLAIVAFVLGGCVPVTQGPDLIIEDVWARQSPSEAGNGAVYFTLKNNGSEEDTLIGASTDVSSVVELHETTMENDVMRMRPVEGQRISIPAGGQVELKPGGLHVMLIDLKQKLEPESTFVLVLQFEKSGERSLDVEVRAVEGMNMNDANMGSEQ